jgi:deoxyribodipyrimidine photo-lyase
VFNPILQREKFDPEGAYDRRWVPELGGLPDSLIHQPWSAAPLELASAGVELGKILVRSSITTWAANVRSPLTPRCATRESNATV